MINGAVYQLPMSGAPRFLRSLMVPTPDGEIENLLHVLSLRRLMGSVDFH